MELTSGLSATTSTPRASASGGEVRLDERQMRLCVRGVPINLTPLEYRAISYLMHRTDRIVSQFVLSEHIYSPDHEHEGNTLEALISRARRKLGGVDLIETRRGLGYGIKQQDTGGRAEDP